MKANIYIAQSEEDWSQFSAETIFSQASQAILDRGFFSLVLSGGTTPQLVYKEIASDHNRSKAIWKKWFIFWGDERCVPETHKESNFRIAKEAFLDLVPIPNDNIFRIKGELQPEFAAEEYEQTIEHFFLKKHKKFDTTLLGLGQDGHTASLFPGTSALEEDIRWVVANLNPYSKTERITLTYPAINCSRNIIFLVTGKTKADIVSEVFENSHQPPLYPAKKITGKSNSPIWIIDKQAGSKLSNEYSEKI